MAGGELVPDDVSKEDLRQEAGLRAYRAGYDVTRDGSMPQPRIMATVAWGVRRYNVWPRDAQGRLIGD